MADPHYYGVDVGGTKTDVAENASSSPGKDVEVNIDLDEVGSKEQALIGLDFIRQRIIEDTWPPA